MNDVQRIWIAARNRHGYGLDGRCRLSPGIRAVLLALLDGPAHGSEIARRAGQDQGNVTRVWLPKLERFGFVEWVEEVPASDVKQGKRAGGRPAVIWDLTRDGKELAGLLAEEEAV